MLSTDVNEQYTKLERMLSSSNDAQYIGSIDVAWHTVISVCNTKTKRIKNQLPVSNWFWTLSFAYSTYIFRSTLNMFELVFLFQQQQFSFFLRYKYVSHKMLNLWTSTTTQSTNSIRCEQTHSLHNIFILSAEQIAQYNSAPNGIQMGAYNLSKSVNIMWILKLIFFSDESAFIYIYIYRVPFAIVLESNCAYW